MTEKTLLTAVPGPAAFFTDFDGTIKPENDDWLAPADLQALRDMKAAGWTRVVATGRSLFGFVKAWRPGLELDWLIFSSGAGLCAWSEMGPGALLTGRLFTPPQALAAVEAALALNYGFFAYAAPPDNHHFFYRLPTNPPAGFLKRLEIFAAQSRPWPSDGMERLRFEAEGLRPAFEVWGSTPSPAKEGRTPAPLILPPKAESQSIANRKFAIRTLRAPGGDPLDPRRGPLVSSDTAMQHRHNSPEHSWPTGHEYTEIAEGKERLKQVAVRQPFGATCEGVGGERLVTGSAALSMNLMQNDELRLTGGSVIGGHMMLMVPGSEADAAEAELRRRAPGLSVVRASSPFGDGCLWLEIFPPEVSKGRAAEALVRRLGLDPALCAAAGNDYNDRDLLDWAGRPFVTADAPADLRSQSNGRYRIIPPAGQGGLARAWSEISGLTGR